MQDGQVNAYRIRPTRIQGSSGPFGDQFFITAGFGISFRLEQVGEVRRLVFTRIHPAFDEAIGSVDNIFKILPPFLRKPLELGSRKPCRNVSHWDC